MEKLLRKVFLGKINVIIIIISLIPLVVIEQNEFIHYLNIILFIYFVLELIYKIRLKNTLKIELYLDVLNIISYIPSLRVMRLLKVFRIIKIVLKSKDMKILLKIFVESKHILLAILKVSLIYMVITSILLFNLEPQTFNNSYFLAFYWSGITLTTVGYGDVYPVTQMGQTVALISSFLGIGIIGLPTGLIGAQFINNKKELE